MRKALIGVLMAATMATPLWAAPGERVRTARQDGDDSAPPARAARQAQRAERQEARQEARQETRQEARQERQAERQVQQVERQQVQVQQPVQVRQQRVEPSAQAQQSWQGRTDRNQVYRQRIEETRAASAASARDGSPELQRQAARNQARSEQRLREQRHDRRDDRRDARQDRREDRRDWREDRRDDRRDHRRWDRNWRNDHRFDWQRYRYSNRNIFSRGRYYAPYRNHRYNRLSIGLILGSVFFGQNYWITDPWYYRLPPAYPGTRWVRYYDDVLLIDVYSGEVIDVIYDFFW